MTSESPTATSESTTSPSLWSCSTSRASEDVGKAASSNLEIPSRSPSVSGRMMRLVTMTRSINSSENLRRDYADRNDWYALQE